MMDLYFSSLGYLTDILCGLKIEKRWPRETGPGFCTL